VFFNWLLESTKYDNRAIIYILLVLCKCYIIPLSLLVTYNKDMAEDHPEALFQQKVPQVYLDLQKAICSIMVELKVQQQPPVMRSEQFR